MNPSSDAIEPRPDQLTAPESPVNSPVRRRLVAYFSGFDPQGPSHYHQMYRREAARQADVSGYHIQVGKRQKAGPHIEYWSVEANGPGFPEGGTQTRYEFMRWDDIVRQHWPRGRLALLMTTLFASWAMWRNGVMWRSMKTSWPMFLAIALPGALLLVMAMAFAGVVTTALWLVPRTGILAAIALLLICLPALAWLGIRLEKRTQMAWLMRSLACLVRQGGGQTPDLEQRLTTFARHIAQQARSGQWDEVLVVGHSSGAMLAMITTARALNECPTDDKAPANDTYSRPHTPQPISLLTLGHCAPLLSEQAEAQTFRCELAKLRQSDQLHWVDFGAPPDGCCFPLVDPCGRSGVPANRADHPRLLNPRFAQLFEPDTYAAVRADKFRCHFQYLTATEKVGAYDYFAMTAGEMSLATRWQKFPSVKNFKQFQSLGGPNYQP